MTDEWLQRAPLHAIGARYGYDIELVKYYIHQELRERRILPGRDARFANWRTLRAAAAESLRQSDPLLFASGVADG